MTGKGSITLAPQRRLRWILAILALWLVTASLLGAWWSGLVLKQSARIAELEATLGLQASERVGESLERTRRMLFWETGFFFALIVGATGVLVWAYFRDERRARGLQAFFASVTHELRTPLTSIRLQAESLADGQPDPEVLRRLLEDTQRLEGQVERTLELARVEGGGRVFAQSLRLRPWVERSLASWRETHGDRVTVRTEGIDPELEVRADTSALGVILRNLLENSLRHSRRDRLTAELRAEPRPGGVALIYRDDGDGYADDPQALGTLFHRGPQSQGAGVGLYLVRVLMQRMAGRATFRGGKGFEIELLFPAGGVDGA